MFSLNNKGQTLVMFVLLIPLFLMILALVVDIGNIVVAKQELNNINYLAVDYGLEHIMDADVENKMTEMIKLNVEEIDEIDIKINNGIIFVKTKKDVPGILSHIFDIKIFEVTSSYQGSFNGLENKIERVK